MIESIKILPNSLRVRFKNKYEENYPNIWLRDHIKGMHHSTGIHLCKTFEQMTIGRAANRKMRNQYHKFIVLANDFDVLQTLMQIKRSQARYLNTELREINNQIKEKRNENNSKS